MGQKITSGVSWGQKLEGGAWFAILHFFTNFSEFGFLQLEMAISVKNC